jgi:hypothetical protein
MSGAMTSEIERNSPFAADSDEPPEPRDRLERLSPV